MKIKNGFSYKKNGWTFVSVNGKPKERGFAMGYFCAEEFKEIQKMLQFYIFESFGYTWDYFIEKINEDFKEMTKIQYHGLYLEMEGIAEGCNAAGCKTTIDEIIAWNFYYSLPYWFSFMSEMRTGKEGGGKSNPEHTFIPLPFNNRASDKCSAFMAVGDWTTDGKIVAAHNSFCDYIDGQYCDVILDIQPIDGFRIIMQTCPCFIWSGTDFFVTTAGIIGTETTIGGFQPYEKKIPVAYRIRTAMQYASSIDEYLAILTNGDSGDYANSWLIGDIKTNEIARIELGLKFFSVHRTKNGNLIGFNAPIDPRIRNIEVQNSGFYDVRRHQGARRVRLSQLMDKYKGKIDIKLAQKIISDHYDVYLKKDNNPCSRTVCSHYDLDAREYMSQSDRPLPYSPRGAVDGMVCDTNLAKNMSFIGRYGSSCGTAFNKDKFCKEHIQYENFCKFLKDRPSQPWTKFQVSNFDKNGYKNYLNSIEKKQMYISGVTENPNLIEDLRLNSLNNVLNIENDDDNINRKFYVNKEINYIPNNKLIKVTRSKKNKDFDKIYLNKQAKRRIKTQKILRKTYNQAFKIKTKKNKTKKTK
jgi:hypothetical protein